MLKVVVALVCAGVALGAPAAEEAPQSWHPVATLLLDNPFDAGSWGAAALCPEYTFVREFEVLYQPAGSFDDTAVNAVKLYCSSPETGLDVAYVTSSTSPNGQWMGLNVCQGGWMTGFRAKVLEYQGLFTDDVAVQDMMGSCQGNETIGGYTDTSRIKDGDWSSWTECPLETAVCGLQTRVENPQLVDDDTAITDISLFCCELPLATLPPPLVTEDASTAPAHA